jgi:hypothetical protein
MRFSKFLGILVLVDFEKILLYLTHSVPGRQFLLHTHTRMYSISVVFNFH